MIRVGGGDEVVVRWRWRWRVEAVSSYVMAISCFKSEERAGCIGSCIVEGTIVEIAVG